MCTGERVEDPRCLLGVVKGTPVVSFALGHEGVLAPPAGLGLGARELVERSTSRPVLRVPHVPRRADGRSPGYGEKVAISSAQAATLLSERVKGSPGRCDRGHGERRMGNEKP